MGSDALTVPNNRLKTLGPPTAMAPKKRITAKPNAATARRSTPRSRLPCRERSEVEVPGPASTIYRGLAAVNVAGVIVSMVFSIVLLPSLLRLVYERHVPVEEVGTVPVGQASA